METQPTSATLHTEDLTDAQRARLLAFYEKLLKNKCATQAEMRAYAQTDAYQQSMTRLSNGNGKHRADAV